MSEAECAKQAEAAFTTVFEHGPSIELDHHVVYHARASSFLRIRDCFLTGW